ncbi:hypothetical protein DCC85_07720 [Paenibacillus sp. CAA11]|uniref:hypothetical protein n=1 Tax=Paenibacillus sp. CAA11 TaxID=1532905 RepID=UPI000D387121|nr:hypothetical protein [Paenibacillus sp. CAA11]AWB44117.1 hypothetical protein DCC85_07720 [Paenibacillus sp. CAA11]
MKSVSNQYLTLWMTQFLCSPDPVKLRCIQEAEQSGNSELLHSIHFHLNMRNQQHLLYRRKTG